MRQKSHVYGLLAEFDEPEKLVDAARAAHKAGYRKMDGYAPFPIHGLAAALGLRATRLPLIVLAGGIIGCIGGFLLQYFASVHYYPMNIGGRPFNSWPAFIVITFETTILCAGLSAVLGMLALNGLPQPYHPLFGVPSFDLASRTHFFLCIEARDRSFDLERTADFLKNLGPSNLTIVSSGVLKKDAHAHASTLLAVLCVGLLGLVGCDNEADNELWKMDDFGRMTPMERSNFFADGQSGRPAVEGTVPRGQLPFDPHLQTGKIDGKDAETFPFLINRAILDRGRRQYTIYCAICHNDTGDGNGMIVRRGFVQPPSYHLEKLRAAPVGHFFDVITNGWGAMYDHRDRVSVEDRWAIAAYIRVLQFSQNADVNLLSEDDRTLLPGVDTKVVK